MTEKNVSDWIDTLETLKWFELYPKDAKKNITKRVLEEGKYAKKEIKKDSLYPFTTFWYDAECIYEPGDYIDLIEQFSDYTLRIFNPKKIECSADDENYNFSFKIGRKTYQASFPLGSDYVDENFWNLIEKSIVESYPNLLMLHSSSRLGVVPKEAYEHFKGKDSSKHSAVLKKYPFVRDKNLDDFHEIHMECDSLGITKNEYKKILNSFIDLNKDQLLIPDYRGHLLCHDYPYDLELLKVLFSNGVDPDIKTNNGDTLIHLTKNIEVIEYLVEECNLDPHQKSNIGKTPLHHVNNIQVLQHLIENYELDPEAIDSEGNTPLHYCNNLDCASYLIKKCNVNYDTVNKAGLTPLYSMFVNQELNSHNKREIATILIQEGSSLDLSPQYNPILFYAPNQSSRNIDIIEQVLKTGYDLNKTNAEGISLIAHLTSVEKVSRNIIDLFLSLGAKQAEGEQEALDSITQQFIKGIWSEKLMQEYEAIGGTPSMAHQAVAENASVDAYASYWDQQKNDHFTPHNWGQFLDRMIEDGKSKLLCKTIISSSYNLNFNIRDLKQIDPYLKKCIELNEVKILCCLLKLTNISFDHDSHIHLLQFAESLQRDDCIAYLLESGFSRDVHGTFYFLELTDEIRPKYLKIWEKSKRPIAKILVKAFNEEETIEAVAQQVRNSALWHKILDFQCLESSDPIPTVKEKSDYTLEDLEPHLETLSDTHSRFLQYDFTFEANIKKAWEIKFPNPLQQSPATDGINLYCIHQKNLENQSRAKKKKPQTLSVITMHDGSEWNIPVQLNASFLVIAEGQLLQRIIDLDPVAIESTYYLDINNKNKWLSSGLKIDTTVKKDKSGYTSNFKGIFWKKKVSLNTVHLVSHHSKQYSKSIKSKVKFVDSSEYGITDIENHNIQLRNKHIDNINSLSAYTICSDDLLWKKKHCCSVRQISGEYVLADTELFHLKTAEHFLHIGSCKSVISSQLGIVASELAVYHIESGKLLWRVLPIDHNKTIGFIKMIITGEILWILSHEKTQDEKKKTYLRAHNIYTGQLLSKKLCPGCHSIMLAANKLIAYSSSKVVAFEMK